MNYIPSKISIIVPIFKVEKYIEKCVRSLFEQTLDDIEYIFVDDCSPDNSIRILKEVLEEYPNRYPNVKIIKHDENKGLSAARMTGLLSTTGLYIAHCDSDDWVELDMYERMYNKIVEENADIVCCSVFNEFETKREIEKFPSIHIEVDSAWFVQKLSLGGIYSSIWSKLVNRKVYFDNNVFPIEDIVMWEDLVVVFRLIYFSRKTVILNYPLYHYSKINSNSILSNFSLNRVYDQIKVAKIVDAFFLQRGNKVYEKYKFPILSIKFRSKLDFFIRPRIRNVKLWKEIYPESNEYIWRYDEYKITYKFVFYMMLMGLNRLSLFLFDNRDMLRLTIKNK